MRVPSRGRRPAVLVAALAAATLLLAGCGGSDAGGDTASASAGTDGVRGTVTVFAAASLRESFTTLGKRFEAAHPGVRVVFNFAASSGLAAGIGQGAPADVFASASTKNMDSVVQAGDAADPKVFVKNVLEIAVPPDNPAKVTALADLTRPGLKLALCQAQVPCGATARKVFANARLTPRPVTLGADVKAVLTAVRLGEVDAGLVYVTDVRAAGTAVKGIEIPAAENASTSYPIATLTKAPNAVGAKSFVDYVLSAAGSTVLTAAGFAAP